MNSNFQYFAISCKVIILAEQKPFQTKEIVILQVRGDRVLGENRLERKRQSDQRKQEVREKEIKRAPENRLKRGPKQREAKWWPLVTVRFSATFSYFSYL